jgi:hypothetical protein
LACELLSGDTMAQRACTALILISVAASGFAAITDTSFATGMNFHANTGASYYHKTDIPGADKDYHVRWMFSFGAGYRRNFGRNSGDKQQAWLWSGQLDFNYLGDWQNASGSHLLYSFSGLGGIGRQFDKRTSFSGLLGASIVRAPKTQFRPTIGAQLDYAFAGNMSADIQYLHTMDIMKGINSISTGLAYYW